MILGHLRNNNEATRYWQHLKAIVEDHRLSVLKQCATSFR